MTMCHLLSAQPLSFEAVEVISLDSRQSKSVLDRLDLRYTFPRIHQFAELGKVPGS